MLYTGTDWTFPILKNCFSEIERIAHEELKLDTYPNRIEIITSEQMLDVYTSHACRSVIRTGLRASGLSLMRMPIAAV